MVHNMFKGVMQKMSSEFFTVGRSGPVVGTLIRNIFEFGQYLSLLGPKNRRSGDFLDLLKIYGLVDCVFLISQQTQTPGT